MPVSGERERKSRAPGLYYIHTAYMRISNLMLALINPEFPRMGFAGNSSGCIKRRPFKDTAAIRYPPDGRARGVWPSERLRSVLLALGFVTAPNTGRILMLHAA